MANKHGPRTIPRIGLPAPTFFKTRICFLIFCLIYIFSISHISANVKCDRNRMNSNAFEHGKSDEREVVGLSGERADVAPRERFMLKTGSR